MLNALCNYIMYSATILSLFLIDYFLGKGFVDTCHRIFCKLVCFVRKTIREEQRLGTMVDVDSFSLPVLVTEIMFLGLAIAFLNKYKQNSNKDRIDGLLKESREALRQTNDFLEKWRLRRLRGETIVEFVIVNVYRACYVVAVVEVPSEYTYLDEEPQEIKPFDLEVPILHMAIIDTLGTARSQPESGDAGDIVNYTDSAVLSMTSLLDDDIESISNVASEENIDKTKTIDHRNRILWDVLEEDAYLDE